VWRTELAVTGVAETGNDESVLVQSFVDRRGENAQVQTGSTQELDAFGGGQHADDGDGSGRIAFHQQLAGMGE